MIFDIMPFLYPALRKTTIAVLLLGTVLSPVSSYADPLDDHLSPRAEVSVKGGSDRSLLTTEFWAPLAQQSGRVVYTDLRLMGDDDDNREGNLGLGYRQVTDWSDSVLGGHVWIDRRRTAANNTFHQVTLGVESLGNVIDLRANGYIPLNGGGHTVTTPNIGSSTPYLAGSGLFYDTNGSISETPQYGIEAEAGYRVPILQRYTDTIRIYGGGYSFFREGTDSTTGYRIRTEAVINPVLSLGARFQHDAPRGSQGFLEATLRFPFSAKKLYQQKGLYARLDESPERDVDIVTAKKIDTGLRKEIINTTTGDAQRILYVDNSTTNGDGTIEHPFNNLTSAQAALKANDILYIRSGTGTTQGMDQGITISQSGVSLIGSGSALTVGGYTFLNAGTAPVITNTQLPDNSTNQTYDNSANVVLVKGDNALISGITATGATHAGIAVVADEGQVINNITITNNTTSSNIVDAGIVLKANGGIIGNAVISNNSSINNTGAAGRGIFARAQYAGGYINNITITGNTVNGNNNNGINIQARTGGNINQAVITNNTTNYNTAGSGVYAEALSGSRINNVDIENNISIGNQFGGQTTSGINARGISVIADAADSQIVNTLIRNNITQNNANDGIRVQITSAATMDVVTIDNNLTTSNMNAGGNGIDIQSQSNGKMTTVNITNNNLSSNQQQGMYFSFDSGSTLGTLNLINNTANGNNGGGAGFYVGAQSGGRIDTINAQNLTASGNRGSGLQIFTSGAGSLLTQVNLNNVTTINNNIHGTLFLAGTGTINSINASNITTSSNTQQGLYFTAQTGGTIGNITADSIVSTNNTFGGVLVQVGNANTVIGTANLSNVTSINNKQSGIVANAFNGQINNLNISNSIVTGNLQYGTYVRSSGTGAVIGTAVINGNTASSNSLSGIYNFSENGGIINALTVSNNTANNNTQRGIYTLGNIGNYGSITINNNTAQFNSIVGIHTQMQSTAQAGTISISNNTASNNNSYGMYTVVSSVGASIGSLTTTGNTTNANGDIGNFTIASSGGVLTTASITNNFSRNNTGSNGYGLRMDATGTAASINNATISGNVTTGNSQTGLFIYSAGTSNLSASVLNNTSTGNSTTGITLRADNTSTFSASMIHNTANSNTQNGLYVYKNNGVSAFVVDAGGGSLGSTGNNRISGNTGTEVRVDGGYALSARTNYWGGGDLVAGEKTLNGGSTVDSTGFLTVDPGP